MRCLRRFSVARNFQVSLLPPKIFLLKKFLNTAQVFYFSTRLLSVCRCTDTVAFHLCLKIVVQVVLLLATTFRQNLSPKPFAKTFPQDPNLSSKVERQGSVARADKKGHSWKSNWKSVGDLWGNLWGYLSQDLRQDL